MLGNSPELRHTMGTMARELVENEYSWPAKLAKFCDLIDNACAPTTLEFTSK